MPDIATLFAWFVMAMLFGVTVAAIVGLGSLPGSIARRRNHPHAEAINAASWIGLALGGITWPIAFVWAFIPWGHANSSSSTEGAELRQLRQQVADLQAKLEASRPSGGQHA
ncbi:DUF3302 domain-containing protein [Blastopirellula sp. J2-11]|uniref:DUF3302 domain-containing protein n=1 Tax=Blastopirellula sp. J2-11 TaxID=2943192 RepID=UPI0021C676F0|nr:DUF3302 domain-containing protein [Blastopirellula sp. J2-11]UUO06171.1 DUF3302 domain-containing protein [Blastopirellula sp. J2-11]